MNPDLFYPISMHVFAHWHSQIEYIETCLQRPSLGKTNGHCRQVDFVDRYVKYKYAEVGLEQGGRCLQVFALDMWYLHHGLL